MSPKFCSILLHSFNGANLILSQYIDFLHTVALRSINTRRERNYELRKRNTSEQAEFLVFAWQYISVKSNKISAGKMGKDSRGARSQQGRACCVPALISPHTAPFPFHWLWLSSGTWVSRIGSLNASSFWRKSGLLCLLMQTGGC